MKNLNNILIEIGTEELPYKNLYKISDNINIILEKFLKKKKISFENIRPFITLRRIAFKIEKIEIKDFIEIELKIISVIEKLLCNIKFKVKMRWGIEKNTFIRPIKWYVLMLNNKLIKHSIFNIKSQNKTLGHKANKLKINVTPNNYEIELKNKGHVICSYIDRQNIILKLVKDYAKKKSLDIVLKKNSIKDITSLIEYPSMIICSFKKAFLKLPEEIITTTLLKNQFCFLLKKNDKLINKIIIIADAFKKNKEIAYGYTYIINTKLSEIEYLYNIEKDYLTTKNINDLKNLNLELKLGTFYEKTMRIKNITKFIRDELKIKSKKLIKASMLIKMDMLTKIANELPEITGLICSYNIKNSLKIKKYLYNYNKILNNKNIKKKYSAVIIIADKIDNITNFFILNKKPTGSKDPFNLKKDAKLITKTINTNKIDINLDSVIKYSLNQHECNANLLCKEIMSFIINRITGIKNYINFIKDTTNILNLKTQIKIVKNLNKYSFKKTLVSIVKRISKITDKNKINLKQKIDKKLLLKNEEKILFNNIKNKIKVINALNKKKLFFESIKTYMSLENIIKKFFDSVLIIDQNTTLKQNRLKILNIIKKIFLYKINLNQL